MALREEETKEWSAQEQFEVTVVYRTCQLVERHMVLIFKRKSHFI